MTSDSPQAPTFRTGKVFLVACAHLVHDVYSSFINPLLPLLIEKFQISFFMSSILAFTQRLPSVLNPLVGMIAEKTTKKKFFVILAPGVTAVAMSLLGVASGFIWVALLCFTAGISVTFFHVPAPVIVRQLSGKKVGKGMSLYMFGGEIARTLGPVVLLGGVSLWGMEGLYRMIPLGVGTSILLYWRLAAKERRNNPSKEIKRLSPGGFKDILVEHRRLFALLFVIFFLRGFVRASFTTFLPTYMKIVKGNSLWISGISLSVVQLSGAVGVFFSGMISDRIGRKKTLLLIFLISPGLVLLFLFSKGPLMFGCFLLLGATLTAPTPVILAMLQELNTEKPAFVNSIYMFISFFGRAITMVLMGMMGDWIGLQNAYVFGAALGVVIIPFVMMLRVPGPVSEES